MVTIILQLSLKNERKSGGVFAKHQRGSYKIDLLKNNSFQITTITKIKTIFKVIIKQGKIHL